MGTKKGWEGSYAELGESLLPLEKANFEYLPSWGDPPDSDKIIEAQDQILHHRRVVPHLNALWSSLALIEKICFLR